MNIKAIETVYNGYRFRSRLEARWAVFFDAIGISYEYEPEGFELSDGTMYLPDFYLKQCKTWFEVKGVMSKEDKHKTEQFIFDTKMPLAIGNADFTFCSPIMHFGDCIGIDEPTNSYLARCYSCGETYFIGESASYECTCCEFYDGNCTFDCLSIGDKPFEAFDDNVKNAFLKAKQARFEHGESG